MEKMRRFFPVFVMAVIAFLSTFAELLPIKPALAVQINASQGGLWTELYAVSAMDRDDSEYEGAEIITFTPNNMPDVHFLKPGVFIRPSAYRVFALNKEMLQNTLSRAPMQFTLEARTDEVVMTLPMPDGALARFRIEESQILSKELQERYPEIRTYRARGIDDPSATASLDLTPLGFHAYVTTDTGTFLVDPVDPIDTRTYLSYWKHDVPGERFGCLVGGRDPYHMEALFNSLRFVRDPSGDQLTTYRLAISATGEYTEFFAAGACPDPPSTVCAENAASAQITTTVNRVSGIYEQEVAISLNLVFMNIYDDPDTDPFTGDNVSVMRGENQTDLDANLGSANYDIGHIFSAGGTGGIARLSVVCDNSFKAWGATSLGNPSGDVFDVDFVSHEMGHQFGGNHTWNGNLGSCSDDQFVSDSAYEPGSGSTIMAYAGICGDQDNQDVQPNSDDYFHTHSFDEITAFRDSSACGTVTPTGNSVPTVDAGPDYTIPRDTPFTLTASGDDADEDDVLTFNWEQFDLGGPRGLPQSDCTSCPLFRSRPATISPSRTFPRLEDILSGAPTPWEVLPTVDRTLNFRVTVRDNQPGHGGVDYDAMVVTVAGAPFRITSPSAGDELECGGDTTITWDVGGGSVASDVRALISDNGGTSFSELISSTSNDGSETKELPRILTDLGRIKLEAVGNIFFDISDQFSIDDTLPPDLTVPADLLGVECTSPEGAAPSIGNATAIDQCDSDPEVTNNAPGDGVFPIGTTTITWTAEDESGNTSSDIQQVQVVDTTPPSITAPEDITAECTSPAGTPVDLGEPIVNDVCDDDVAVADDAPLVFPLGATTVTWSATDNAGNTNTDTQDVTIVDTTPPDFDLRVTPSVLWPPNHKLVTVRALIIVRDVCDAIPTVRLVSITSNEPDNGLGDGNTTNDIQRADFGTDDREFQLRAERSGRGDGRIYTIVYEAEDDSGNVATREATVRVPKSKKKQYYREIDSRF